MPKLSNVFRACGKTINLAKQQTFKCPRKPPLNSLVFEKLPEPKCSDKLSGFTGPKQIKPIRVCKAKELKDMYCPPTPCGCKPKTSLTYLQRIFNVFKFGMKVSFVYGLVSYTYNEGIWSDAFRTSCFLGKFVETCPPIPEEDDDDALGGLASMQHTQTQVEPCAPFIPRADKMLFHMGIQWNKTVQFIFWLIVDAPGQLLAALFAEPKKVKKKREPCEPQDLL